MLFNKENNGSEELYAVSGIFQASADYKSIEAEINSATDRVRSIVGVAVVKAAEDEYAKNDDGRNTALIDAVRLPIAYLAISMHAKLSGVSHGDTGRKLKVDENEKIPFAWMLDRDDRELRERYYRALDALFSYLDGSDNPEWQDSSTKKALARCLVRTTQDFDNIYPIENSHYMFYSIMSLMLEVQTGLIKYIGKEKFESLLNNDDSVSELQAAAKRYVVLNSVIKAAQRWGLDIFPLAIARRFSPSYQGNSQSRTATTEEIDWYISKLHLQAQDAALELQALLNESPYTRISMLPDNDPKKKYFTV